MRWINAVASAVAGRVEPADPAAVVLVVAVAEATDAGAAGAVVEASITFLRCWHVWRRNHHEDLHHCFL